MGAGASSESDNESVVRITSTAAIEEETDYEALRNLHEAVNNEVVSLRKFIATRDAEIIHNAVATKKSDKLLLVTVLCNRTPAQLQRVNEIYLEKYGKDLDAVAVDDVGGPIGALVAYSKLGKIEKYAKLLEIGLMEKKVNINLLADVTSFCTNAELIEISKVFESKHGSLEQAIKKRVKGSDAGIVLIEIFKGERDESDDVNEELAAQQAEQLYKDGIGKIFGTEEKTFINILCKSSRAHVQAIDKAYLAAHKHNLVTAIRKEFHKDSKTVLTSLLQASIVRSKAYSLSKAMEGSGCDSFRVACILACIDQQEIGLVREEYNSVYGIGLMDSLEDELTGDFKTLAMSWFSKTEPSQGLEAKNINRVPEDEELQEATLDLAKERKLLLDFIALTDAMVIERACVGKGTRDKDLIAVLCARSRSHLKRVNAYYEKLYQKSLIQEVHAEIKGFYQQLMVYSLMPFDEVDATVCKLALDSKGKNKLFIAEIFSALSNKRKIAMKSKYAEKYGEELSTRIEKEFSGVELDLIQALVFGSRDEDDSVDEELAESQAHKLKSVADGVPQTETTFIEIVTHVSFPQLQCIKDKYMELFGVPLEDGIIDEGLDPLKVAMASTLSSPETIYATALKKAFKGKKTSDAEVARVLGSNDKPQIQRIAARYQEKFGESLIDALKKNVTGNFQLACVTFVATADPILPDELRAITDELSLDEEERMPTEPEDVPQGRPPKLDKCKHRDFSKPNVVAESEPLPDDEEVSLASDDGSAHSSDGPATDDEWEMTPKIQKLLNNKRRAAANGNRYKVRMINKKIQKLIDEQIAAKQG